MFITLYHNFSWILRLFRLLGLSFSTSRQLSGGGWPDVDPSVGAQLHPLRTEPRHRLLGAEEPGDVLLVNLPAV